MKRIESLTPEQTAKMAEFRDKWIEIGLCTKPADRAKAEAAIVAAYAIAGKAPPRIVWCSSPLAQGLTRGLLLDTKFAKEIGKAIEKAVRDSVWDSVRASVRDSVWDSVRAGVWDSVRASVWDSVRASVRDSVWDSVRAGVGASVGASVRASVRDSVWDSVRAGVRDSVWDSVRAGVGASVGASVWDSVGDSVWDSVRAGVRDSVWDSVRAGVGASVGASVWDSVRASVRDSVWASVGDSVRASVRDSVWDSVRDSVRDSVGDSVGASVRASVWASVGDSVGASVRASVRDSVWDSVRAGVWDSVRDSVRDSVGDSVGASVWDSVRASVRDSGYGAHDAGWLSFYSFFCDVVGLKEQTAKLAPLIDLAHHCGWWLPHEKICWVSERHNVLNRDANGRLHCENGPALAYPDGFAIHAWHGVRIAAHIIEEPKKITIAEIDGEKNAEVRRVMLERFGTGRYLLEGGAKELHRDDCGILYRKDIPDDEPLVMVRVLNSTPEPDGTLEAEEARRIFGAAAHRVTTGRYKEYQLRVPPGMRTAREAVAWTVDVPPEQYRPQVET